MIEKDKNIDGWKRHRQKDRSTLKGIRKKKNRKTEIERKREIGKGWERMARGNREIYIQIDTKTERARRNRKRQINGHRKREEKEKDRDRKKRESRQKQIERK